MNLHGINKLLFFICFSLFLCPFLHGREKGDTLTFYVVGYNVENLFDCYHDTLTNDYEFLPDAARHWNQTRYRKKLDDIARTLIAAGEGTPPALVALCEVENERVLYDLTHRSALRKAGYRYILTGFPDPRGLDVALLYQPGRFKPISHQSLRVTPPQKKNRRTRRILHVSGLLLNKDTLDLFVCHFPSRTGGVKATEPYRLSAAKRVKSAADSLMQIRIRPQIIIMGDFNDYPKNASVQEILRRDTLIVGSLHHLLATRAQKEKNFGSYKYQGKWGLLDHIIVSENLLQKGASLYTDDTQAEVFRPSFLLAEDEKYGGKQPFRTYNGMKYIGGYSDHLPVRARFQLIY